MSRCHRKIVAGATISRIAASWLAGSVPASSGQPRPVRPRQPRMSPRPLAQRHRELMAQHQDLGVLPPRLPPRQAQHRHGPGHYEEDQLQAHKPKIIARRPEPDLPARHRSRDRADDVPQSICPGDAGFRHPQAAGSGAQRGRHPPVLPPGHRPAGRDLRADRGRAEPGRHPPGPGPAGRDPPAAGRAGPAAGARRRAARCPAGPAAASARPAGRRPGQVPGPGCPPGRSNKRAVRARSVARSSSRPAIRRAAAGVQPGRSGS